MPFSFYQEVRIARPTPENTSFRDQVGAIIGRTTEPDEPVGYALSIPGQEQVVTCLESELEPTGRQFRREDFYDDAKAIHVRVDSQQRGHLA